MVPNHSNNNIICYPDIQNFAVTNNGESDLFEDYLQCFVDSDGNLVNVNNEPIMGWQADEYGVQQNTVTPLFPGDVSSMTLEPGAGPVNPYWTIELENWFAIHPEYQERIDVGFINKYNTVATASNMFIAYDGKIYNIFNLYYPKFTNEFDLNGDPVWQDPNHETSENPKFDGYYKFVYYKLVGQFIVADIWGPYNLIKKQDFFTDSSQTVKYGLYSPSLSSGMFYGIGIDPTVRGNFNIQNKNYLHEPFNLKKVVYDEICDKPYQFVISDATSNYFSPVPLKLKVGINSKKYYWNDQEWWFDNNFILKESIKNLSEFDWNTDIYEGSDPTYQVYNVYNNWILCTEDGLPIMGWPYGLQNNVAPISLGNLIKELLDNEIQVLSIKFYDDGCIYAETQDDLILIAQIPIDNFADSSKLLNLGNSIFEQTRWSGDFDGVGAPLSRLIDNPTYTPSEISPDSDGVITWDYNGIIEQYK